MCGRFSNSLTKDKMKKYMPYVRISDTIPQSYNIAPSHDSAIVTNQSPFSISTMSWGLLPYGKTEGNILINARCETMFEKPTFKYAIQQRRCLVVADSFYEWKKIGRDKIAYRIRLASSDAMIFGGIYNIWESNGTQFSGFVIVTTQPNQEMNKIHNRAPVILSNESQQKAWISDISSKEILELTQPLGDNLLHIYRVSNQVNKPINNSVDLHKEIPEQPTLF